MKIKRFDTNPIIHPALDERLGTNINGPSLIRVPDWIEKPLGQYYLYFAHHDGHYIRLAYSDTLAGPWTNYGPGVLPLEDSFFEGHIASPDVHVDHGERHIRLYYHGCATPTGSTDPQTTKVALSADGLNFTAQPQLIGNPYLRAFDWDGHTYALTMPGVFYRSRDGLSEFERGPTLFTPNMRHSALKLDGHTLSVFYTNAGDCPEQILLSTIDLRGDWQHWTETASVAILAPELEYEGGHLPQTPSLRGLSPEPVCELRDPAIFQEDGRTYLLYCIAGERGIGIAEIYK